MTISKTKTARNKIFGMRRSAAYKPTKKPFRAKISAAINSSALHPAEIKQPRTSVLQINPTFSSTTSHNYGETALKTNTIHLQKGTACIMGVRCAHTATTCNDELSAFSSGLI